MERMIVHFIFLPLVLALSLKERSGDTVVSYILWVTLKTSYHITT